MPFPDALEITPLKAPPQATIRVPGSKSITNRALILAALSDPNRGSELRGVLQSEDTEYMVDALRALGFRVQVDWPQATIHVRRGACTSPIPEKNAHLFVGNSGTCMRFLTALVGTGHGSYQLDGVARMRERPIADLLDALRQLGVNARSLDRDGFPPVLVETDGSLFSDSPSSSISGKVRIRGEVSSQFLSGLLMVAPLARKAVTIEVNGPLVSRPYVAMTLGMMKEFGVEVAGDGTSHFEVPVHAWYQGRVYEIEPDASSASYFLAAAAVTGGQVDVPGLGLNVTADVKTLYFTGSLQGDTAFANLLYEMGCRVTRTNEGVSVQGGPLHGIVADMNAISDTVMTLAAVACFAEGPTTIRNVAHIRHKETDRLAALATELRRIGVEVEELADGLKIVPRPVDQLHGAEIETYNDHRMAMSLALVGLRVPGIVIKNPACVAKTYPGFFDDLAKLSESGRP
jgi:3-phosphoshikimate 1-carboxyvinyltransferase